MRCTPSRLPAGRTSIRAANGTINASIVTGMSAAAAHRLSRPSIRNPPQTNSRINTGIAVHPGNPFFSKNSIVPGNVKTSGLSRPWVNITAPTCDSQDQNPQVDTVLGEEMTIHRNSRLRIKCYDQKKGFRTRRHFVSFKKSGAERLPSFARPFVDAAEWPPALKRLERLRPVQCKISLNGSRLGPWIRLTYGPPLLSDRRPAPIDRPISCLILI